MPPPATNTCGGAATLVAQPSESGLLGRLGRLFPGPCQPDSVSGTLDAVDQHSIVPVPPVPCSYQSMEPHRPLTGTELMRLRRIPAKNQALIIFALNLFRGAIVG